MSRPMTNDCTCLKREQASKCITTYQTPFTKRQRRPALRLAAGMHNCPCSNRGWRSEKCVSFTSLRILYPKRHRKSVFRVAAGMTTPNPDDESVTDKYTEPISEDELVELKDQACDPYKQLFPYHAQSTKRKRRRALRLGAGMFNPVPDKQSAMERRRRRTALRLAAGMIKRNSDDEAETDKYTEPTTEDELAELKDQRRYHPYRRLPSAKRQRRAALRLAAGMIKRIPGKEPATDKSTKLTSQDELDELKEPCEPYRRLFPDNTTESALICGAAMFKDPITTFVTMVDGKILTIVIGRAGVCGAIEGCH